MTTQQESQHLRCIHGKNDNPLSVSFGFFFLRLKKEEANQSFVESIWEAG